MLHAPATDSKVEARQGHRERESPAFPDSTRSPRSIDGASDALGNQAMLRMDARRTPFGLRPSRVGVLQRKCACDSKLDGASDSRLAIGPPDDAFEQEADRVAERVMRTPDAPTNADRGRTLQRKCAACEEEDKAKLRPKRQPSADSAASAPPVVHEVLRSPGQPLDAQTRAFMEPRFGRDFTAVRAHTDGKAAESARAVQALAYTVGTDVVFAHQQYAPATPSGKRLLAHELAHVVQQEGPAGTAPVFDLSAANAPMRLRRTVTVTPAAEVADVVDYFNLMCPQGFTADGQRIVSNCTDPTGPSCECLCEVASNSKNRNYLIRVIEAKAGVEDLTLFDNSVATVTTTSMFPGTQAGNDPIIEIPAAGSDVEFGAFAPDGWGFWAPISRILGHEMCGHGRLRTDTTKGRAAVTQSGQDNTVGVENAIATEQGWPLRGYSVPPRYGASFFNNVDYQSIVRFDLPDGAHFESPDGPSRVGDYPEPDPNQKVA
jgi:hypothetical protein